jgi:septum formation protein
VLILASGSPRRRDLLSEWRFDFEVFPADVEEVAPLGVDPAEIVLHNARLKSRAVSAQRPGAVVLGVDTLVAFEGDVLGKPRDMQEAEQMLERLNGRSHQVFSGVVLRSETAGWEDAFAVVSTVTFHLLDPRARRRYLDRIQPLDKAGAYAAQEESGELIATIAGLKTNVIGMPMEDLVPRLASRGVFPNP